MTRNRWITVFLFCIYLALLLYLMFFSDMEQRGLMVKEHYTYNFVPFREISRNFLAGKRLGLGYVILNLYGNIAGFMPLGFMLPVFSRRCRRSILATTMCGYLLSYGIEMSQLAFRAGSCDVDDLILNTFGAFCGYLVFQLVQWIRRDLRKHG